MTSAPPLNALRVFEAVVRAGSFRAAAEELCVTQSAVSHQIKYLEEWFGSPLFTRQGNRPVPLPHAEELARNLSLSLGAMNAACRRARNFRISQPLVIAAIPSIAVCWLIPRLSRFRRAHPEIDLRVMYAVHGHHIDFQDVHFAFAFAKGAPNLPGVEATRFLPGESVPVCSPQLAGRLGNGQQGPVPGTDMAPLSIAAMDLLHDTNYLGWETWFKRAGIDDRRPAPGTVFEDFNLMRAAALSGQGVALCPHAIIRPDLENGRLVRLSSIRVFEEFGYYLLEGPQADSGKSGAPLFREWVMRERGDAF